MMHLIIASKQDEASRSIAGHLLETVEFREDGFGSDILKHGDYLFSYIEERHLFFNEFDHKYGSIRDNIDDVIFLSRHSSAADVKSITVHPTGNYGEAKLGGMENTLSVSDPRKMTSALRSMAEYYSGSDFSVTFEATHHGPLLGVPNFFIEIGTKSEQWKNREALDIVVHGLFSNAETNLDSFVGVGGGHYMPKITKYALENHVNIGHMISKHALENINEGLIMESIRKTGNCTGFVMDKKGTKSKPKEMITKIAKNLNLEIIYV